jgi:hypothetical protein
MATVTPHERSKHACHDENEIFLYFRDLFVVAVASGMVVEVVASWGRAVLVAHVSRC